MRMSTKVLLAVLTLIIIGESWLIVKLWKPENNIVPNSANLYFSFLDKGGADNYVSIDGSWFSETKLYNPVQGSKIDCWRDQSVCNEAQGYIFESNLFVDTNYYDIVSWTEKEITAVSNAICRKSTLKIDRVMKQATLLSEKTNNEGSCADIQNEPIISTLMRGLDAHLKLQEKE
jgi:hypothetical protein